MPKPETLYQIEQRCKQRLALLTVNDNPLVVDVPFQIEVYEMLGILAERLQQIHPDTN